MLVVIDRWFWFWGFTGHLTVAQAQPTQNRWLSLGSEGFSLPCWLPWSLLFLKVSMQWDRVVAFPCQFHLFLVEQVSFSLFIHHRMQLRPMAGSPLKPSPSESAFVKWVLWWFFSSLWIWDHTQYSWGSGHLSSFCWNSESERVRCLRFYKHQSLVFILH